MKTVIVGLVIFGLGFVGADYMFSIPNVLMSHSTGVCVEVENFPSILFSDTAYNCENMPTKYNHIWVQ